MSSSGSKPVKGGPAPSSDAGQPAASGSSVSYDVQHVPGGIDRVILAKRDERRDVCVQVTLASPGIAELGLPGKLDLPSDWTLESAILVHQAEACGSLLRRWPSGAVNATGASGSVRWGSAPTERTNVDLTLSFPGRGSGPAQTEKLVFQR